MPAFDANELDGLLAGGIHMHSGTVAGTGMHHTDMPVVDNRNELDYITIMSKQIFSKNHKNNFSVQN